MPCSYTCPRVIEAIEWSDVAQMRQFRLVDGRVQDVALQPGPKGFMIAPFADGVVQTEVPNLWLHKRPAANPLASRVHKGQDSDTSEIVEQEEDEQHHGEEEDEELLEFDEEEFDEEGENDAGEGEELAEEGEQDEEEEQHKQESKEQEKKQESKEEEKKQESEDLQTPFSLPPFWQVRTRIRKTGDLAGTTYKEYVSPGGQMFRSLKAVQRYHDEIE